MLYWNCNIYHFSLLFCLHHIKTNSQTLLTHCLCRTFYYSLFYRLFKNLFFSVFYCYWGSIVTTRDDVRGIKTMLKVFKILLWGGKRASETSILKSLKVDIVVLPIHSRAKYPYLYYCGHLTTLQLVVSIHCYH